MNAYYPQTTAAAAAAFGDSYVLVVTVILTDSHIDRPIDLLAVKHVS